MGHRNRGPKKVEDQRLERLETGEVILESIEVIELRKIYKKLEEIARLLQLSSAAQTFAFTEKGENMGAINPLTPGSTKTIDVSTLPVGGLLQPGSVPTYSQDNTTDVSAVVPASDGMSFSITGNSTFAGTSVNVTASGVNSAGVAISSVCNIPLSGGTGGGTPATGFDFNERGAVVPSGTLNPSFRR